MPDPDAVRVDPAAVAGLAALGPLVGRLAIVTGRPPRVVVERGRMAGVPGLESLVVLGHYGLVRWDAATARMSAPDPHPGVQEARAELPSLLTRAGEPDAWIEDKGSAVAVHTRRTPDPSASLVRLEQPLRDLARRCGLVVEPGRLVLELRPPGVDKGAAVRALAREIAPSAVLFAGDDLGDLAAFDAVDDLRADGIPGLLVCSGSDEVTEVAARADLVVDGPAGVADLLAALHTRLTSP